MASRGFFNPVDVHVGQRIRQRRTLLGLSQTTLGEAIGLTFQQVQKYERGSNRVSSSRLFDLGRILDVPFSHFYEDMPGAVRKQSPVNLIGVLALEPADYDPDPVMRRETLELTRAYYKIPDAATRKRLFELIKSLSKSIGAED
jgi:transcriptional regulator with XRE-family HTH domain